MVNNSIVTTETNWEWWQHVFEISIFAIHALYHSYQNRPKNHRVIVMDTEKIITRPLQSYRLRFKFAYLSGNSTETALRQRITALKCWLIDNTPLSHLLRWQWKVYEPMEQLQANCIASMQKKNMQSYSMRKLEKGYQKTRSIDWGNSVLIEETQWLCRRTNTCFFFKVAATLQSSWNMVPSIWCDAKYGENKYRTIHLTYNPNVSDRGLNNSLEVHRVNKIIRRDYIEMKNDVKLLGIT